MDHNILRLQRDYLSCGARAQEILASAKAGRRELTEQEQSEFNECVSHAERVKTHISLLESRQGATDMDRNLTLPTNGVLPGDNPQRFTSHNRVSSLRAFKGPDAEERALAAGKWIQAVVAREYGRGIDTVAEDYCNRVGWRITNAASEGSGVGGGYTVPSPLSSTIIDVRESVGVARRAMNIQPMTSDTLTIPRHASGLTVMYGGESQAMQTSDVGWGQISLVAKKRYVANQISQELIDDSLISVVDHAVYEMSYALADKEDQEFINGDGGSSYGGVRGLKHAIGSAGVSQCAAGHDTWAEIDMGDVTAWFGKLGDKYHSRMPVIICSSAFYHSVLLRLHAQAGGNSIVSLQGGDRGLRTFLGFDVLTTPYMPTASAANTVCAFFGAFSAGCVLGDRMGARIGRSDDYAFLNDLTTLKAVVRYDMQVFDHGDAQNAGCYVALATAS